MKVVIEIPRYIAALCVENNISDPIDIKTLIQAVKNGIPLPKGYGKLIDADELLKYKYPIDSPLCVYEDVVNVTDIYNAPTIIKADKENKE